MQNDSLRREFKYYFMVCEHPNLYTPWTFEGVMGDIQHSLYNGEGLEPWQIESKNLERRIGSLDPDKQQIANRELSKAIDLAKKINATREKEQEAKDSLSKKKAERAYRNAWRNTSFFYKIANRRKNPKKIDFDGLSASEIERKTSHLR